MVHDDPILSEGLVEYVGQPIFVVVADSHDNARRAARKADISYEELPAILTPQEAKKSAVLRDSADASAARRCKASVRKIATPRQG
ncbi:hypothetical protein ACFS07_24415 [Undibacterium arcticum]